jgi:hypothetical protein
MARNSVVQGLLGMSTVADTGEGRAVVDAMGGLCEGEEVE